MNQIVNMVLRNSGLVLGALLVAYVFACCAQDGLSPEPSDSTEKRLWTPVLRCDFSTQKALDNWFLEGAAKVSITDAAELMIENTTKRMGEQDVSRSTLWFREPFWGDLKFEMEVKGEPDGGNIFFFNAQPLQGHRSIFEWQRPRANYVDYTADPRMHFYTLGLLRPYPEEINFRFLGGELAYLADPNRADPGKGNDPDNRFDAEAREEFARKTILQRAASPFKDPGLYYRLELTVIGSHVRVVVDGQEIFDFLDSDRGDQPLKGGYFAFRNFAKTKTWCRFLQVSRRE